MIKRCRVLVMRDGKGMMHTAMVIGRRIDRRVLVEELQHIAEDCGYDDPPLVGSQ